MSIQTTEPCDVYNCNSTAIFDFAGSKFDVDKVISYCGPHTKEYACPRCDELFDVACKCHLKVGTNDGVFERINSAMPLSYGNPTCAARICDVAGNHEIDGRVYCDMHEAEYKEIRICNRQIADLLKDSDRMRQDLSEACDSVHESTFELAQLKMSSQQEISQLKSSLERARYSNLDEEKITASQGREIAKLHKQALVDKEVIKQTTKQIAEWCSYAFEIEAKKKLKKGKRA